jgi:hypothetical protein
MQSISSIEPTPVIVLLGHHGLLGTRGLTNAPVGTGNTKYHTEREDNILLWDQIQEGSMALIDVAI